MMNVIEQSAVMDPRWNFNGNIKVGNIATWSTLPSDRVFESERYGKVKGSCNECCCEHCGHSKDGKRPPCYVFKSHRYPSVVVGQARNTLSMRNDPEKCFQMLSDYLSRKRIPIMAGRFNQSGELENKAELDGMRGIAIDHNGTPFYIYSKMYDLITEALLNGEIPQNMTINFSIWHEQGIEEYLKVAHLPNVKAFVYCDKNSDPINGWGAEEYAEHGIHIQTWCKAYGMDGKMNHDITCDHCQKCFNMIKDGKPVVRKSAKVIGCWDH